MFSKRTNWNFSENKLSRLFQSLRQQGVAVIDLSESNPTRCNFKYLGNHNLLSSLSRPENMNYEPSPKGKKEARVAIQSYYRQKGIEVNLERIFLTASTSEAYSHIFRLLADPYDHILVPKPSYPLFHFIADLNDVTLNHYPLHYQNDRWQINFQELNNLEQTKAIVTVHPNNPTGSFLKLDEAGQLIKFAKSRSLAIISDEVFSDYGLGEDPKRKTSFADTQEVLTFTLGGISKSLGLPQMKISWVVLNGPESLVEPASKRLEMISDTFLSVNTPSQEAFSFWLSQKDKIQNEIKNRIDVNYSWLSKTVFGKSGISGLKSEGGWYAILKLPDLKTEEEWALEFLEKDRIFVHPGYFFDFDEEAYVVVSLLPESKIFQEGCERMLTRITNKFSSPLVGED